MHLRIGEIDRKLYLATIVYSRELSKSRFYFFILLAYVGKIWQIYIFLITFSISIIVIKGFKTHFVTPMTGLDWWKLKLGSFNSQTAKKFMYEDYYRRLEIIVNSTDSVCSDF